jgi:hypothetical protein
MISPREGLTSLPPRMRKLPLHALGFPIPHFAASVGGAPDVRVVDELTLAACHERKLCWLCGERLGDYKAFIVSPMSAVNRISNEPPSHIDCAKFVARFCPFLMLPKTIRRSTSTPAGADAPRSVIGIGGRGVSLVWVTRKYKVVRVGDTTLFDLGDPWQTFWYARGQCATRDQVEEAFAAGLGPMYEVARAGSELTVSDLDAVVARVTRLFPKHVAAESLA